MGKKSTTSHKTFEDKTYRIININNKIYSGKDGFKNRTSGYIIDKFPEDYFKGKRILDLGCASGAILFDVRDHIKKGIGVDVDYKKLNIGKQITKENKIKNIFFYEDRLERFLNKTEESYDCIFLLNILHHIQSPYNMLNLVAELSEDLICIEAPKEGFYNAYNRDLGKEVNFDKLDLQDIIDFMHERNFILLKNIESENQENFMGDTRHVCIFKKKQCTFTQKANINKLEGGIVIGPGASGKTRLLHDLYNIEIKYKAQDIIKNRVLNNEKKSLKYGKNVKGPTKQFPYIYIAPNYKSSVNFKPNIDEWINALKDENTCAIICYIKPHIHRERILNRIENKPVKDKRQHLDNYPFSYQNLFYKLEKNNIKYHVLRTYKEENDCKKEC